MTEHNRSLRALDDATLQARAVLGHKRFEWAAMSEPLRERFRAKAREMNVDLSLVEVEPTDLDMEAILVDAGRMLRRRAVARSTETMRAK